MKKILYITALAKSANGFLIPHFRNLKKINFVNRDTATNEKENIVKLVTSFDSSIDNLKKNGVDVIEAPIVQNISICNDLKAVFVLTKIFLSEKPDVVHAHMSKAGLVSVLAARLAGVPRIIYHNHGMAQFSAKGLKKIILTIVEKITCTLSDTIIFCSQSTLETAVQKKIVKREKTVLLGHGTISGVDITKFSADLYQEQEKSFFRKELKIDENKVTFAFVGRLVVHKGIYTLLKAWDTLPEEVKAKSQLLLIGNYDDDKIKNFVEEKIKEDNGKSIFFLGFRNDMPKIYSILDYLVLPSWHEGFPYSVLESQSMGIPSIVTNVTGNIDAVENNETGYIVAVNDEKSLQNIFIKVVENTSDRDRLSENCIKKVKEKFSEEFVMNSLCDFYKKYLNE